LLDEPTKGLDPICRAQLTDILRGMAKDGAAVIFVTHDLDFAAETADRITLIFGGQALDPEPAADFMRENTVYTTAASRIGRSFFPGAASRSELIGACLAAEKERVGNEK
jgi:energy-coupling factor transport system ATP-binding protein